VHEGLEGHRELVAVSVALSRSAPMIALLLGACGTPAAPPNPPSETPATVVLSAQASRSPAVPIGPVHVEARTPSTLASSDAMSCVVVGEQVICWGAGQAPHAEEALANSATIAGHGELVCGLDAEGTTLRCTRGPDAYPGPSTEAVVGGVALEVDDEGPTVRTSDARLVHVGSDAPAAGPGAVSVLRAHGATCSLSDTGSLSCTSSERAPFVIDGVLDFALMRSALCVLRADAVECGSLASWRNHDAPERFVGTAGATRLVAGAAHVCVLSREGDVSCAGANEQGELGRGVHGERSNELRPVLDVTGATEIAAGAHHTCASTPEGVRCWGDDTAAQVSGQRVTYGANVLAGVRAVASSWGGSCAVRTDGSLWCWGIGRAGQLGDGSAVSQPLPARAQLPGVGAIAEVMLAGESTCVLSEGRVACFGGSGARRPPQPDLGSVTDALHLGGTGRSVQVVRAGGEVLSFDAASGQRLEVGRRQVGTTRVGHDVVQVVGDGSFVCALDGEGHVWAWGGDFGGELGDGGDGLRGEPTAVIAPVAMPASEAERRDLAHGCDEGCGVLEGVRALTSFGRGSCATLTSGRVACWGEGSHDRFAEHVRFSRRPVLLDGVEHARAACVGGTFLCVLHEDGTVRCRGTGAAGEARNEELAGLDHVTQLSCGGAHACALREDGSVHCWGESMGGRLGSAALIRARAVPVAMP
jgi:alpha-tubulin suppressor-like RCC1 family protein